jgi:hypothetical protein
MDDTEQPSTVIAANKKGPALAHAPSPGSKLAQHRMDNKQRKKRAHKRTLRRPNTNG